ncbi:MAG: cytochrome c4 [Gammaproteobacteria bacterium]|nr:cytochrome c4 [Gammaproteobacteria bacterium]MBU6509659.1 cytochrome c4 [Gammaproteobacteria bacterium]MDE1983989.1 cytochrome c4 [Gammaproteobacteria bacterium]MDE2108274.1 cytochrome c4 [Gammaproteobacteria bacterium]MDE2460325.1 cytochrome c4 [Gammaproteobacteria bacterium]
MNKIVVMLTGAALMALAMNAGAAGDQSAAVGNAAAGQTKAATCAACHGADGNSVSPQFPKLAGQNADYIVRELQRFKSGERKNAIMSGMAAPLSEQDMLDVAAWFSSQTVKPGEADPNLVKTGEAIYRGGDAATGVPACLACHGPDGAGNGPMLIPALAGQHADYVVTQLQAFANASRKSPMMDPIAARLTPAQMQAVASYIQGLHYAPIQP